MFAIVNFSGRAFSHFGFHFLGGNRVGVKIGVRISSSFFTSIVAVNEISAGGMSLWFINSFSSSSLVNNLILNLEGQSGALCPGWVTPVTSYQSWILFSTKVGYQSIRGWADIGTQSFSGVTLLNEAEWDRCETSGSRCWGSVGRLKGLIGHAVLVYILGCLIPILWRSV